MRRIVDVFRTSDPRKSRPLESNLPCPSFRTRSDEASPSFAAAVGCSTGVSSYLEELAGAFSGRSPVVRAYFASEGLIDDDLAEVEEVRRRPLSRRR
jgi:hypothetical protein